MKNNNSAQNIRSKFVKQALIDTYNLSRTLQENSNNILKQLLQETVKNEFNKILKEDFEEKKDDEEYVEDTPEISDVTDDTFKSENNTDDNSDNDVPTEDNTETNDSTVVDDNADNNVDSQTTDDDDWSEFDDFKVSDKEYDFTSDDGANIAKVFKLMGPEDSVRVMKDDEGNITINDSENGTEYLIKLDATDDTSDNIDSRDNSSDIDNNQMEENNMKEETLREFDSNVKYTDSYQKQDVMTNDGVKEPAPNKVNDWDKGVPHDTKRPWGGDVKKGEPFDKTVKEEEETVTVDEEDLNEENIDEANLSQSRWNDTHAAHNRVPAANKDEFRRDGIQKTSKGTKYRATGTAEIAEGMKKIVAKAKDIYAENQELRKWTAKFKQQLTEAVLNNSRLNNVVTLLVNNSTTLQEKKNIVDRFNAVKDLQESKNLFETISKELKNKTVVNESLNNIDKQYNANGSSKINEEKNIIDESLKDTLDLMRRMEKY